MNRLPPTERKPLSTPVYIVSAVVLFVVVLLGLYVRGYFVLGTKPRTMSSVLGGDIHREYRYDWQAAAYWPLLRLEAAVTGKEVKSIGPTRIYRSTGEVWRNAGNGKWLPQ